MHCSCQWLSALLLSWPSALYLFVPVCLHTWLAAVTVCIIIDSTNQLFKPVPVYVVSTAGARLPFLCLWVAASACLRFYCRCSSTIHVPVSSIAASACLRRSVGAYLHCYCQYLPELCCLSSSTLHISVSAFALFLSKSVCIVPVSTCLRYSC